MLKRDTSLTLPSTGGGMIAMLRYIESHADQALLLQRGQLPQSERGLRLAVSITDFGSLT